MKADRLGAGEILLTSMDCDGTKAGYDLELTRMIAENVSIPVIASGGAGTKEHFYDALTEGKADAALAASLFHYKELEICDLKDYLAERGVSVRRDVYKRQEQGKTFVIVGIDITNSGADEIAIDNFAKTPKFSVMVNGQEKAEEENTILP